MDVGKKRMIGLGPFLDLSLGLGTKDLGLVI